MPSLLASTSLVRHRDHKLSSIFLLLFMILFTNGIPLEILSWPNLGRNNEVNEERV